MNLKILKKFLKNTMKVWKEIVSLPFFPDLENKKIKYIINCIKQFDKKIENHENL